MQYWGSPLPIRIGNQFAFVVAVESGPPITLSVDYADWLWGEEAEQACQEDGLGSDCAYEGLYYIRNVNPRLRTLQLADDASVFLAYEAHTAAAGVSCRGVDANEMAAVGFEPHPTDGCAIDPSALPTVWPEPDQEFGRLVWLIVEGGVITAMQEQYVP